MADDFKVRSKLYEAASPSLFLAPFFALSLLFSLFSYRSPLHLSGVRVETLMPMLLDMYHWVLQKQLIREEQEKLLITHTKVAQANALCREMGLSRHYVLENASRCGHTLRSSPYVSP